MKNKTNLFKRIRNIIVGNTLPKNEDLWIDTSNGEKNAVLKYKGNPLIGGGGNSGFPSPAEQNLYKAIKVMPVETGNYVSENVQIISDYTSDGLSELFRFSTDYGELIIGYSYTAIINGTSYTGTAIQNGDEVVFEPIQENSNIYFTSNHGEFAGEIICHGLTNGDTISLFGEQRTPEYNYNYQLQGPYDFYYKNIPSDTIVRTPTAEDLEKLPTASQEEPYGGCMDLENGIVPYNIIFSGVWFSISHCSAEFLPEKASLDITYSSLVSNSPIFHAYVSEDGSLMGIYIEEVSPTPGPVDPESN